MIPVQTTDGLFHAADPLAGQFGTPIDAGWLNAVQAEIVGAILAAGITPSAAVQLPDAMRRLAAPAVVITSAGITLEQAHRGQTVLFTGLATATMTLPTLSATDAGWWCRIANRQPSPYVGVWVAGLPRTGLAQGESLCVWWSGSSWLLIEQQRSAAVGQTSFWEGPDVPFGWIVRDATPLPVADYPLLLAAMYCGDAANATAVTGYRYSNPAAPATSRTISGDYLFLADMRGEFERALDLGRGIDTGRVAGSSQASQNLAHTHSGTTAVAGAHTHKVVEASSIPSAGDYASGDDYTSTVHAYSDTSSAGEHSHAFTTASDGGGESRPRNVAHRAIRRAF